MKIPHLDFGGDGPPLHFAHANAYPPGIYRQFLKPLADHYHVMAMLQRPLWSEQDPAELQNWHPFADDLIHFCRRQNLTDLIGVGHSLGAVATLFAALKEPELFRCLVLIEPVFLSASVLQGYKANPDRWYKSPLIQRTLNRRNLWTDRQAAFDRFRSKTVFQRLSDEALWDYVNYGLHETENGSIALSFPREWEASIYSCPPPEVWDLLPQLTLPTLAIRGSASDTLEAVSWERWQSLQPSAHFVELDGSGHLVPMERPRAVAEEVLCFVRDL